MSDVLKHVVEEFECGVALQSQQPILEAQVVIAPLDAEMDPGPPQTIFEVAVFRPMLEPLFVGLDRLEPVMGSLLLDSQIDRRRGVGRHFIMGHRPLATGDGNGNKEKNQQC